VVGPLNEVESILKDQNQAENKQNTINKILNNHYDAQVHDYIIGVTESDRISKFIVEHRLSTFWKLVLRFESGYQVKILQSISYNYSEATGWLFVQRHKSSYITLAKKA
jgi:hypothetical protein